MSESQQVINIHQYLPHRNPMLLVDFITEISSEHVVTHFTVSNSCIFLFNKLFQEAGIIENMAQTCSAIVGQKYYENTDGVAQNKVLGFISAIKKVEIFNLPQQDETIITSANLLSRFKGDDYDLCTMSVTSHCNDQLIALATINLFLQKM